MGDIGGLQLLPTQKKRFSFSQVTGGNRLFSLALVLFVVLLGMYGTLKLLTGRVLEKIGERDAHLETIYRARNKTEEEKLTSFERQIKSTKGLLASHLAWAQGLRSVQKLILPQVTFISLSADASKKTYSFNAMTNSYSSVAKQIAAFYQSNVMNDIKLSKVQVSENGRIDFTMDLTFKPEHFLMRTEYE